MHWDWKNRSLKLSVGELAGFSLASTGDDASGKWRAELGVHWHQVLRDRTAARESGWEFEVPVKGTLWQDGWEFHLSGRMDQFCSGGERPVLREIKTVSLKLPAPEEALREKYPTYFHQAMLYAFLLGKDSGYPRSELMFLEIQTGLSQTVELVDADLADLSRHLQWVVTLLEERRSHFHRLRKIVVPHPFENWRPGQESTREALAGAQQEEGVILFEAPTGYGKTGLVLEQALGQLAAGRIERILILTGKNTGHSPIIEQLQTYLEAIPELSAQPLRSRADHTLNHELENQMSSGEILQRWREKGLSARQLLEDGILELESIRRLGQDLGIPPWAITRLLLPYADIWIADYNYLFDPGVSRFFTSIPTWDPAKTYLVIDEAHNLPERAAASHSYALRTEDLERLLTEVQFARFPGELGRSLDVLFTLVKRLRPCDALDPPAEADLIECLRAIPEILSIHAPGPDELSVESQDLLWSIPQIVEVWDHPSLPIHIWAPSRGTVLLSCLDAAETIQPVVAQYGQVLFMSATLQPWSALKKSFGLENRPVIPVTGHAPWLTGCFEVMVDARVDTRFREREKYFSLTAATIGETVLQNKGCTVAFFPSYRYAETVLERLQFSYPALRAELQPRNLPLEEQHDFLERGLLLDDVLFLILGSRFSEGIDALGDRVHRAIVVSPALPEVNPLQKARESLFSGGRAAAFQSVYLIPAMKKISQALGRLVRSPDQHAKVLLHGKRFLEPDYLDLLPDYLQPTEQLITDEDFVKKWLGDGFGSP